MSTFRVIHHDTLSVQSAIKSSFRLRNDNDNNDNDNNNYNNNNNDGHENDEDDNNNNKNTLHIPTPWRSFDRILCMVVL